MPISLSLLRRAYQLAENGDHENVAKILNAIIQSDPKNIEAWEFYLQTCTCIEELDELADRVQHTADLTEDEKGDILDYYLYRVDKLEEKTPREESLHELADEDPFIIPEDIDVLEPSRSTKPPLLRRQFSWVSSRNIVPLTLGLLFVTYILDKTIPNNGLIGFFIVLSLSFLYVYWLSTTGVFDRSHPGARTFAKDFDPFDEFDELEDPDEYESSDQGPNW